MARKRVTYRPSKTAGIFGVLWGAVFVVIGLVVVIPSAGAFGILWTLMALGITGYNAYCAFGKGYVGPEIHIEEDGENSAPSSGGDSVQQRLQELRNLYDRSLITEEEYQLKKETRTRGRFPAARARRYSLNSKSFARGIFRALAISIRVSTLHELTPVSIR